MNYLDWFLLAIGGLSVLISLYAKFRGVDRELEEAKDGMARLDAKSKEHDENYQVITTLLHEMRTGIQQILSEREKPEQPAIEEWNGEMPSIEKWKGAVVEG
mgnify:CR=1 FL=1